MANENMYNSPSSTASGTASDIGAQARTDYYYKKAIISVRDNMYFMPLADVRAMPKHMGKKMPLVRLLQLVPTLLGMLLVFSKVRLQLIQVLL